MHDLATSSTQAAKTKATRVLLADRDSGRCGRWLDQLVKQPTIEDVRCVEALEDIRAMEPDLPFDVCLVGADSFPPEDLVEAIGWIREAHPRCRVVVHEVPTDPDLTVRFLEAGAWSYVPERACSRDVVRTLEAAGRGESTLPPQVAGEVIRRIRQLSIVYGDDLPRVSALQNLTPREREILSLIARRMSNLEIARELVVEVGTVKNHIHSLLKKLGVGSRHEAAALGWQEGLVVENVPD
jgi:DNA-binding NarL/FixJ family response regulator